MSVTVWYVPSTDEPPKPFKAMCFAQLGKGSAYGRNPEYRERYEEFCDERSIGYSTSTTHFPEAVDWYSKRPMSHIELRQETTFSDPKHQQSWMPQAKNLVRYLLEDSPFSVAYLSTYEDWVKGVVKIDINTVTAEMTLHACQWFRLAGQSSRSFDYLMSIDPSDPWINCILAFTFPHLWKGEVRELLDRGDDTVVPSYINKLMLTDPSKCYELNAIHLSVYQLWGYPMNLLGIWGSMSSSSKLPDFQSFIYRIRTKYKKSVKMQGIFTELFIDTIKDPAAFVQEVKQWASK